MGYDQPCLSLLYVEETGKNSLWSNDKDQSGRTLSSEEHIPEGPTQKHRKYMWSDLCSLLLNILIVIRVSKLQ